MRTAYLVIAHCAAITACAPSPEAFTATAAIPQEQTRTAAPTNFPTRRAILTPTSAPAHTGSPTPASTDYPPGQEPLNIRLQYFYGDSLSVEQVSTFLRSLQTAVAADDRETVAEFIDIDFGMLTNLGSGTITIRSKADFLENYSRIVNDDVKTALYAQEVSNLFVNWQGIMIGVGQIWLNAYYLGDADYREIRITAIQPHVPALFHRIHAVRGGDAAARMGDYDLALANYQRAIFDQKLEPWADPSSRGNPDPEEQPRLSAYSRYRIMLLHVVQGHLSDARTVYDTLQKKFPSGAAGHPYAELAAAFWNEYSLHQDISSACALAIQYASDNHDTILEPLGATFYGEDYGHYLPQDICPFK